jgi:hypothetical protein
LEKLFELLGLGIPFYLGAATYCIFWWLDSNASDEATQVIRLWLQGRSQHKPDLGNLIIKAFDRIYTSPLLSFRAFRRSAGISATFWLLLNLVPSLHGLIRYWGGLYTAVLTAPAPAASDPADALVKPLIIGIFVLYSVMNLLLNLGLTVLSDYLSLPFVRRFLQLAQNYPITSSIISSIIGVVVIIISYILWIVLSIAIGILPLLSGDISDIITELSGFFDYAASHYADLGSNLFGLSIFVGSMRPAFIIHLWLPLFAISSVVVKLLYPFFRAVDWAEWFLKQGDAHPLKAIGIVATIIVFGSATLVKEAWTFL